LSVFTSASLKIRSQRSQRPTSKTRGIKARFLGQAIGAGGKKNRLGKELGLKGNALGIQTPETPVADLRHSSASP